ncbi:MAG: hypothetical protein JNM99_25095 [Verrucomicrobiaceae bacterium]|nr:hypothetical protein [Verrucomicrobiaceae bacterium]
MKTLLADLGFERNADSIRGFMVQAWLVALLALMASWSVVRWFQMQRVDAFSSEGDAHGLPFMKHTLVMMLQLALGAGIIAGGARLIRTVMSTPLAAVVISPPAEARVLALGPADILQVGARAGYFMIDRSAKKTMPTGVDSRDLRGVGGVLVRGDEVWIASEQGLYRKQGNQLDTAMTHDGGQLGPAYCLLQLRDGRLLAGGAGRLHEQSKEGVWTTQQVAALDRISVLYEDSKGRLWAGSDTPNRGGLLRLDPKTSAFVDASHGLPHRSVCDLAEDGDGKLWIATGFAAFGGAASWDEGTRTWLPLNGPPGLEGRKMRSLFLDSTGALWFCSEYDGIAILKGGQWHQRLYRQGFPCREVIDTVEANGGIWLATERGVLFLEHHPLETLIPQAFKP